MEKMRPFHPSSFPWNFNVVAFTAEMELLRSEKLRLDVISLWRSTVSSLCLTQVGLEIRNMCNTRSYVHAGGEDRHTDRQKRKALLGFPSLACFPLRLSSPLPLFVCLLAFWPWMATERMGKREGKNLRIHVHNVLVDRRGVVNSGGVESPLFPFFWKFSSLQLLWGSRQCGPLHLAGRHYQVANLPAKDWRQRHQRRRRQRGPLGQ